jgi:hypothetical protein
MCNCQGTLWERAKEVNALGLVVNATEAAKTHVAYSRALGASRRAEVLIGEGIGKERAWTAQQYFSSRTSSLRHLLQALEDVRASAEPARVSQADELIAQGAIAELLVRVRHAALAALVDSDLSADAAASAMTALDQRLEEIRSAASFAHLTELLARYTQEHLARTYEDGALNNTSGICMIILILSSLYAVLIVVAVMLYVLFLGLVPYSELLNELINDACPTQMAST